jgi:hypothetical protein
MLNSLQGHAAQAGRRRVRFPMSLDFQLTQSFEWHFGPEIDSVSIRNECQKYFLGGKGRTAHKADNLTAICEPIVMKMWGARSLTDL